MAQVLASWEAPEFEYRSQSSDWYWAVWIIVISISIISIIFHDLPFAILLILSAFFLSVFSGKRPRTLHYEISTQGIRIENVLYPFDNLEGYGIDETDSENPKLLIKSKKIFVSILIIPIRDLTPEQIKKILDKHLFQEDIKEPILQKLGELLGF